MRMDRTFLERSGSKTQAPEPAGADAVAKLAYALWLGRGCPHGSPEEDWYEAERLLKRTAGNVEPRPQKTPRPSLHRRKSKAKAAGSQTAV